MAMSVNAFDHIVLNVTDVEATASWYRAVLGMRREVFEPGDGKAPRVSLLFGQQKINLRPVSSSKIGWFTAANERAGSDDMCFLTDATPDEVVAHLRDQGVAIELGPVPKQGARGLLTSVYCRDPDGNLVEVASYAERH
jgi:catechol 2,3-dioxygenase-like lactoylglutathione lyase family enzyme